MTNSRVFHILYADDNPGDIDLAVEALEEAGLHCRFFSLRDGQEALDFLYRRGMYAHAPRPNLVLLDLNMPRMGGIDALKAIKSDKHLCAIPTLIFTSSARQEDINAAYAARANCYVVKPAHLDLFLECVKSVVTYWMNVAY